MVGLPAPMVGMPAPKMAESRMMSYQVTGGIALPPHYGPPPGTVDRDKYPNVDPNPVKQTAAEPVSTFSIDVDTASYANVRRFLNDGRLPPKDAVRIEELINYFDYDYAVPANRAQPFAPTIALAPSPWAKGKTLMHIGIKGYDVRPAERPPLNLVLLVDVSGSMSAEDKLPLAKKAFRGLVDQLTEKDTVSIAVYAGAAGAVLEPTSGKDKGKINAAFDAMNAGGSTAGGAGLALAYTLAERNFKKDAVNRVMIATDGDFNVGINDPEQLKDFVERKRETGIYLSVLGFGRGNYNDALMQTLAQKGNGIAAYIDTLAEARKVLSDQAARALLPIADDVKIQVEFNPARVAEYRLIGYETRMLNREDFNNDRVDAGDVGAGASVTAIYELTPVGGKTLIDPLRYGQPPKPAATGAANEIAFLKMRWKPPGAKDSQLIERAITDRDAVDAISRAGESTRWATAVAGFGQLLRQESYLDKGFSYADVIDLAQGARGRDEFGWRAEFVQLVRAAKEAAAAPQPEQPPQPGEPPVVRPGPTGPTPPPPRR
jgi:Ca-activated chloride channel family protein